MKNKFTYAYSDLMQGMFYFPRRQEVAGQILAVLKDNLKDKKTSTLTCLEIGTSAGVIARILSDTFKKVTAIDIDTKAAQYWEKNKKKNIEFKNMNAMNLSFKDNTFDVAVTNQDYEFMKDPQKYIDEIYRVLKPGGICFFGARNKLNIMEGQYNIPFLSWLPESLAKKYIELLGRKKYFLANYKTIWGLQKLCNHFIIKDYTITVLKNPEKYRYRKLVKYKKIINVIPKIFLQTGEFLIPNFIWVLQKPHD
jgi:ubiquinone/menaquinone biosynthesis C-methylase UbiE